MPSMQTVDLGVVIGPTGSQGATGPQGPQGVQGVRGIQGRGVALGGTDGQVLVRDDSVDNGTEWVDLEDQPALKELADRMQNVGDIKAFAGSTIPDKWKVCDGSLVSRTTYADLFTALGTAWGGGDGTSTFAIPDLKGRALIGVGESAAAGHTAHTLGQSDGEEKHTLVANELASHNHGSAGGHTHSFHWGSGDFGTFGANNNDTGDKTVIMLNNGTDIMNSAGSHTHDTVGTNTAHNNMQPYAACNYIIYTGVSENT